MAPAAWAPKPAVEKLPLSTRKDVRDNFEAKKEDYESTIAGHLGFPVKIEFDTNAVAAYADLTTPTLGYYFATYVDGFIYGLTNFAQSYEDIGKEYFKNAVFGAKITLNVNELGDKAPTIDADVKDGVFRILFHHQKFGYNASDLYSLLATAIENAPHDGYSLLAKSSIEKEYNQKVDEAQQQIGEVLNMPDVILDPNFEENYAKLIKKKEKDWVQYFGDSTLKYFQDGFLYQIKYQGFQNDDMLQEGFAEGVPSKTIKLRIVDKTKNNATNEVVVEDGVVYLQTTPERWQYNISDAGTGLVDLL